MNKQNKILLLGRKVGMTQIFTEDKALLPVTVIQAGPCPVVQIKTEAKDGYRAVQIGYRKQKESRLSKAELSHLNKAGVESLAHLKEFRLDNESNYSRGDVIDVTQFKEGEFVDIIGISKGKGFQGVMKRWNFAGGGASHGSMSHRRGGSYGMRQDPGRVYKQRKMPGHMGQRRCTIQNLNIVRILGDKNMILVKGSIPGANGSLVLLRNAKKAK